MAKKSGKGQKAGKALSGAGARERLDALIKSKEDTVSDGSLQVLLALASVTTLVTVDTTTEPPTVEPEDLGSLTFGDPQVGLTNDGVAIFKANLKILLPEIEADIDEIPDNADLRIADVAKFVRLSLLAV